MTARSPSCTTGARRALVLPLALVAAAALAGCDPSPGSVVEGMGRPTVLGAVDVHVLGASDSIATVTDLEVTADGSVWVLNSSAPYFVGFGPDGSVLAIRGRAGGGPEEFRMPFGFASRAPDSSAWVFDLPRHAMIEVTGRQDDREEIALPPDAIPPGSVMGGGDMLSPRIRTAWLGDELLVPRTTGSMQDGLVSLRLAVLGADLLALDPATDSVRTFLALGEVLGDPARGFQPVAGGFPLWYRLWSVCGDQAVRVYDRAANQVRGFGPDGMELAPFDLPPVRLTSVTPRQFARAVFPLRQAEVTGDIGGQLAPEDSLRVVNAMVDELQGTPEQLAAYLPRYVDLHCADDGTVWIQPLEIDRGGLAGGPVWLRVAPDGATDEVHLPDRFDLYRVRGGRLWGVQRDELDVASIAWIEVPER